MLFNARIIIHKARFRLFLDSYNSFAPFMDKIIETYKWKKSSDKNISSIENNLLNRPLFLADEDKMIKSTNIRAIFLGI